MFQAVCLFCKKPVCRMVSFQELCKSNGYLLELANFWATHSQDDAAPCKNLQEILNFSQANPSN